MRIRASATQVEVTTPAKLNLFLEVLAKRSDGFHEIETLMVPVTLFDTLYFQAENGRLNEARETSSPRKSTVAGSTAFSTAFSADWASDAWKRNRVRKHNREDQQDEDQQDGVKGLNHNSIPKGSDNIVVRAVELLRRRAGIDSCVSIRLIKRIPLAAGLGGGSSDAAAALVAANLVWGLGYPLSKLLPLAAELGSDVPFFLSASPAICRGRGEQIEPVEGIGCWHFVIVCPPSGLSTAEVYRNCHAAKVAYSSTPLVQALRHGRFKDAAGNLHNRLQPAAQAMSPWITQLESEFQRLGISGNQMSGSGSSYFGLCPSARHARRLAARLRARKLGSVRVVRSL